MRIDETTYPVEYLPDGPEYVLKVKELDQEGKAELIIQSGKFRWLITDGEKKYILRPK